LNPLSQISPLSFPWSPHRPRWGLHLCSQEPALIFKRPRRTAPSQGCNLLALGVTALDRWREALEVASFQPPPPQFQSRSPSSGASSRVPTRHSSGGTFTDQDPKRLRHLYIRLRSLIGPTPPADCVPLPNEHLPFPFRFPMSPRSAWGALAFLTPRTGQYRRSVGRTRPVDLQYSNVPPGELVLPRQSAQHSHVPAWAGKRGHPLGRARRRRGHESRELISPVDGSPSALVNTCLSGIGQARVPPGTDQLMTRHQPTPGDPARWRTTEQPGNHEPVSFRPKGSCP
jgi:hypothetical protein